MRKTRTKGSALRIGQILFSSMFLICMIGSFLLPLQPYVRESELQDIPPSLPYQMPNIKGEEVVDIQSQITCSMALMKDGSLQQWGQCEAIPEEIKDRQITQIALGYKHILVLDHEGNVYGWGDNSHEEIQGIENYTNIQAIYAKDGVSALLNENQELILLGNTNLYQAEIPEKLQGHIRDFAFGIHHMAIVSEENEIYMLGNLGSELAQAPIPTGNINDIQLNHEQGILLDTYGNLSTWGSEEKAPINTNIDEIAMSSYASYALSNGTIYSWGKSEHGEGDIPTGNYTHIFADTYHMYAVQEDGTIESWGQENYLFGSDELGRDMLTRLVHGGKITMIIGLIACIMEAIFAISIGTIAGLYGGWIDHMFMRFAEIIAAIPFLPLVITLATFFADGVDYRVRMIFIMVLLGSLSWVPLARMIRAQVMVEKEKDYLWSAKIMGASTYRLIRKAILPQIMGLIVVNLTASYAENMLIESSLSFLGFGVQAPYPSWGNMIEHAQSIYVMEHCWWQWILPAFCIMITIWSVHMMGEGLRRKYNPHDL